MFQKHLLAKFGFDTDEKEPSKALVTIYFKRCVSLQVTDLAPPTERFMVDARGLRFFLLVRRVAYHSYRFEKQAPMPAAGRKVAELRSGGEK